MPPARTGTRWRADLRRTAFLATLGRRVVELLPIPAGESARSCESQKDRHVAELPLPVLHVAGGKLAAHGIDDVGKGLVPPCEPPMQRPAVDAEILGDQLDCAAA